MKIEVSRRDDVPERAKLYWVWVEKISLVNCPTHYPEKCKCHEFKQIASPAYD